MPLIRHIESSHSGPNLQLWKIEEPESFFLDHIGELSHEAREEYSLMHHEKRKLEWLSARWLLMGILTEYSVKINRLVKDSFGKPYLKNTDLHLSISHSYPYVAAIVDQNGPTGVDIENPKEKIINIAPRFMHKDELAYCSNDINKLTLYWCAKETLYKIYGRRQLQFNTQLLIDPFEDKRIVDLRGEIYPDNEDSISYDLHGHIEKDIIMVHKK